MADEVRESILAEAVTVEQIKNGDGEQDVASAIAALSVAVRAVHAIVPGDEIANLKLRLFSSSVVRTFSCLGVFGGVTGLVGQAPMTQLEPDGLWWDGGNNYVCPGSHPSLSSK